MKFFRCPVNQCFGGIIWYTFIFEVLFLTTFCNSFWKRVDKSKEIVNIQGLFVLTVGYVDMTTYLPTKYYYIIEEYILFIGYLYYLSVHCHSCCFYIQHHGSIREITSTPVYIFCSILCSMLLTRWRNIRLFYTTFVLTIQKRSRFEPAPPVHYL